MNWEGVPCKKCRSADVASTKYSLCLYCLGKRLDAAEEELRGIANAHITECKCYACKVYKDWFEKQSRQEDEK